LEDPADAVGEEAEDAAFETWRLLMMRAQAFLALPFETMDRAELTAQLAQIGQMEGAA
jgi:arsenate reductase